jgi:hypothetical protein
MTLRKVNLHSLQTIEAILLDSNNYEPNSNQGWLKNNIIIFCVWKGIVKNLVLVAENLRSVVRRLLEPEYNRLK